MNQAKGENKVTMRLERQPYDTFIYSRHSHLHPNLQLLITNTDHCSLMTISLTPTRPPSVHQQQRLAGDKPQSIFDVVRDIGCLQIDPINAVARSSNCFVQSADP